MKMYNLIGIGERAGSGVPNILDVWSSKNLETPIIKETFSPDRTMLILPLSEKIEEVQVSLDLHPSYTQARKKSRN